MATTKNSVLSVTTNAELLSYIINQTPELSEDIDLPVQGQSVKPIGKLILDNQRYRNAFINTVNLIGLTVIDRNQWQNPWENFANRGELRRGQQIRELIIDLAKVYDYNELYNEKDRFLKTVVPDVYEYMHELNFQKFYQTTVNINQMYMAFDDEDNGLLDLITTITENLYLSYTYDKYLIDKYQLCKRMVDGTIPVRKIENFEDLTPRQVLSKMKAVTTKMTFMSPNYNPAGVRRATTFGNIYLMLDADREAINNTEVLSTSFFKDEAQTKTNLALIDSFSETDINRLKEVLGKQFVDFTEDEKTMLKNVIGVVISGDWFMDYYYALDSQAPTKMTEFENPTTLDRNIFLHVWSVFSTSPFENCCVFTTETPSVTSVKLSPSSATVSKGQSIKISADVKTTGCANKAVLYTVTTGKADVKQDGTVTIPADSTDRTVVVTATSIYDNTKTATCTLTVAENQ